MDALDTILKTLEKNKFKVSTDTRKNILGSVYFGIKGENFDGNDFVKEALKKGAVLAVTQNSKIQSGNVVYVKDTLKTLQYVAKKYREFFNIPVIAIGGSNGKTTSKELLAEVLKTKFIVHKTEGSLNNHLGVPLTILSMNKNTEIGVFEIGANHPKEHLELLNILRPTHVLVTNNGMDHLEGFGSPKGSRKANKEIYDWAFVNKAEVFVNKKYKDLIEDSKKTKRILYPKEILKVAGSTPLSVVYKGEIYKTNFAGEYNIENINLAVSVGQYFKVDIKKALNTICRFTPSSNRSQLLKRKSIDFIVDCYNANPTSMLLSLESFMKSGSNKKGVVLGDMLELGKYSDKEHLKIVKYLIKQKLGCVVLVGKNFKKALKKTKTNFNWFENSILVEQWFKKQKFNDFTFLLKGSRGIKVEQILNV